MRWAPDYEGDEYLHERLQRMRSERKVRTMNDDEKVTEPRLAAVALGDGPAIDITKGEIGKAYGPEGTRELTAPEHAALHAAQPCELTSDGLTGEAPPYVPAKDDTAFLVTTVTRTDFKPRRAFTFVSVLEVLEGSRYRVNIGRGLKMVCRLADLVAELPAGFAEGRRLFIVGDVVEEPAVETKDDSTTPSPEPQPR